jgi:hypothetical protein
MARMSWRTDAEARQHPAAAEAWLARAALTGDDGGSGLDLA